MSPVWSLNPLGSVTDAGSDEYLQKGFENSGYALSTNLEK